MVNIEKILGRSWHILWNYRMLWVFGFILALTIAGSSYNGSGRNSSFRTNGNASNGTSWNLPGETVSEKMSAAYRLAGEEIQKLEALHPVEFRMGVAVAIILLVMGLIFAIGGAILRYVSETATIRMVTDYEQKGVKIGFREGWKSGWTRAAWRLFLIDLLVNIPVFVLLVFLGLVAWWIVSAALSGVQATLVTSLLVGIGLSVLAILLTGVLMIVLNYMRAFAWRFSTLEDSGVMESLRQAAALLKRNWKSAGLMWLVMLAINIGWGLAFLILIFPLLIVCVITGVAGAFVAIIPGLISAGLASLFSAPGYWPWIFAAVISIPFFIPIAFSPIFLVRGWNLTYESSVWTLTYHEMKALETVPQVLPEIPLAAGD